MNERIVAHLQDKDNWEVFASLMRTGRITILTADPSRGLDPTHPFLAAAEDHHRNRSFAGEDWQHYDMGRLQFCAQLDGLCVNACKPRQTPPPGKNTFAQLLGDVLSGASVLWRKRPQFAGITESTASRFADFCRQPELAICFLEDHGRKYIIGRNQGFYRTQLYQCAQFLPDAERVALGNLAQSVYADRETQRERAIGTYVGHLAECPNPYVPVDEASCVGVRIVPKYMKQAFPILYTPDAGDVISATLENCGSVMQAFWKFGAASSTAEERFRLAWMSIADEYARNMGRQALSHRKAEIGKKWHRITKPIHCILFLYETLLYGFGLFQGTNPDEIDRLIRVGEALGPGALALGATVFGETAENWVRAGLIETTLVSTSREVIMESAATRAGCVPTPIGTI